MPLTVGFNFNVAPIVKFAQTGRTDLRAFPSGPLRDAMIEVGRIQQRFWRDTYIRNSRGSGVWQPLAESTRKQKRPDRGILRETDRLLDSLTGGPDNILVATSRGVRIGTMVDYAKYHQAGGQHLPKRQIMIPPDQPTKRLEQQALARGLGLQARLWSKVSIPRSDLFSSVRI